MKEQTKRGITAKSTMLIRRPVDEVFEAFVDPTITSRFWFTKSSGRLAPGEPVRWEWEMYDASAQVNVKEVEVNERILIEWSATGEDAPTTVEWVFTPLTDDTTYVSIEKTGFSGDEDEIIAQAIDSTEGFTIVLAGVKALLEHDLELNLVSDHHPEGLRED